MKLPKFPSPAEIISVRQARNLTQAKSAVLVHCTRRTWQYWESGGHKMHPAIWELFLIKSKGNIVMTDHLKSSL